ncbi:glycoside hydrolase family 93 protein [Mycena maculata]|uniref:Glycoside hydrolase family 93 protein n=1 Tax=Mycena maculata TaxID=230809 RepID=A0AAD7IMS6_9AGAR|nr:glycoside hydrolase family 93 protein [Mycena maculata]
MPYDPLTVPGTCAKRANRSSGSVSAQWVKEAGGSSTYPRLTHLADGSALAGFTAFNGATHIFTVTRSTDGAKTFSPWSTIAQGTGDLDDVNLRQLANGNIIAAYRGHDLVNGVYTFYRITTSISTDDGQTWSFLSQINQRAATTTDNGLWEPFIRVANSGALQVYYASENADNDQDILMDTSADNGATWAAPITVTGATTTGRDGMPGCTNLNSNANLVTCIFETTEGTAPLFTVKSVVSENDGVTWGQRTQVYVPDVSGNNAGAPQITTTTAGTLVASFMTDEDNTAASTWPAGGSMKILTSLGTDPAAWGNKVTVLPITSEWPGLYARQDGSGTALGCADNGGVVCRSISFT